MTQAAPSTPPSQNPGQTHNVLDPQGIWRSEHTASLHYPSSGNDNCFAVEDKSFWFRHRNDAIATLINRFPFKDNFVDIGGGNGYQANCIRELHPSKKIALLEPGYQGCLNARKRGLTEVYNLTMQEFDFETFEAGGLGLFDVLEHIEHDIEFLQELRQGVTPGTRLYITVPAHAYLWSKTDEISGHFRRYTCPGLTRVCEAAGFKVLYSSYYFHYAPIPLFLSRVVRDRLSSDLSDEELFKASSKELTSTSTDSTLLKPFHWFERFLLRNARIPFGASVILAAETLPEFHP